MTVYFARSRDKAKVKIGVIADGDWGERTMGGGSYKRHPAALRLYGRLIAIGKSIGQEVTLAAVAEGYVLVERWFHRRHEAAALGGEWFRTTAALADDIERVGSFDKLSGQPPEPEHADRLAGTLLASCRKRLAASAGDMARIVRVGSEAYYLHREHTDAPLVWAVDIAIAAKARGVRLDLSDIVTAADALGHRARYRTHIVRSIEARA